MFSQDAGYVQSSGWFLIDLPLAVMTVLSVKSLALPSPDLFCHLSAADSTGTHSLYTTYKDYELMFHVSTMLPHTPSNRQQVTPPPTQPRPDAAVGFSRGTGQGSLGSFLDRR